MAANFQGPSRCYITVQYSKHDLLSMSWFLDFPHPKSQETATSGLDNLESDTRKISLSVTRSTETGNEHFVILIDETHTSVSWHVGSDLFVVLSQLNSHTLSDGRVRLLSFNSDLFDDDACSMGSLCKGFFPLRNTTFFLVSEIGPQLESSVHSELATSINSSRLT